MANAATTDRQTDTRQEQEVLSLEDRVRQREGVVMNQQLKFRARFSEALRAHDTFHEDEEAFVAFLQQLEHEIQEAKMIQSTSSSVSYSKVINDLLQKSTSKF